MIPRTQAIRLKSKDDWIYRRRIYGSYWRRRKAILVTKNLILCSPGEDGVDENGKLSYGRILQRGVFSYGRPLTPTQRRLSEVHVMFCRLFYFIIIIFYEGILRHTLTEVRETFIYTWWTLAVIRKVFIWGFHGPPNYRVGQKVTKVWHIFWPRLQTFCFYARESGRIL